MKSEIQINNTAEECHIDIEGTIGVAEEWQFDKPEERVATYERFREAVRRIGAVEAQRIVDEAIAWGAQCICLSGLITPSLDEMTHVCEELERRGLRIPVIVGGATTSALHTALKIAPVYGGTVVHSANASQNSQLLARLLGEQAQNISRS